MGKDREQKFGSPTYAKVLAYAEEYAAAGYQQEADAILEKWNAFVRETANSGVPLEFSDAADTIPPSRTVYVSPFDNFRRS